MAVEATALPFRPSHRLPSRFLSTPAAAQRAPVLQQVKVRHPYYYREMFIPQPTTGPSSVAWSPDGMELVFSMQGSLWAQRVGTNAGAAADRRARLRLPARLVARRSAHRVRLLSR